MRTFEIRSPDGRLIRQDHKTLAELKAKLVRGYEVVSEIVGKDEIANGIALKPPLPDDLESYALIPALMTRYGDQVLAWLEAHAPPDPRLSKDALPVLKLK